MFPFLQFFLDPLYRDSMLGSMLMCLTSSLVGVIVFVRRRSLVGEALAHAAYPGIVISVMFASYFFPKSDTILSFAILIGAFLFSMIGLYAMEFLEKKMKVNSDTALCFTLAAFLGFGILLVSHIQLTHALWYRKVQVFLFGQTATMTGEHVLIYAGLTLAIITYLVIMFRQIKSVNFDPQFSKAIGMRCQMIETSSFVLLILAIVIGMRSVGVILMSGMIIAPAAAARQLTNKMSVMFFLSGFFGICSGFLGNVLSVVLPQAFFAKKNVSLALPAGPMILLVAVFFALFFLLFSPKRGLFSRVLRMMKFRMQCHTENVLKALWKKLDIPIPFWIKCLLLKKKLIRKTQKDGYELTKLGKKRATRLIRLHRLWEVYLVNCMGIGEEKVHHSAEEMEHIITPELERKLTEMLSNPRHDPHLQPIPQMEDV
ncbi:MAG: metal ABC transporter permease [Simkaniaceae bacterium]|nr:metal ABC transporter permease [Simkaniaceae bacterium]